MIKRFVLIILAIIISLVSSACYDAHEIEDLAFVVAIGIDKGKTSEIKMTLQFALPQELGGGSGGGGEKKEGGGKGVSVTVVEAPSIYSGLNIANSYISKRINLSHAKIIVFSSEIAKEGLEKYIRAMKRGREFRSNMYVGVARDSAEEYIRNVNMVMEINPMKYYEMNLESYKYTGFAVDSRFINFYLQLQSTCVQPTAILVGKNIYNSSEEFNLKNYSEDKQNKEEKLEGQYKAQNVPKVYDVKSEVMGLAVFDGAKMVGEIDGEDATFHLITSGKFEAADITIPDPKADDRFIVFEVKARKNPKYHVDMLNSKPEIDVKVYLEADISSIQSGINYENPYYNNFLEKHCEEFFKKGILNYLEKTKNMNADICQFGRDLKMGYLLWNDWIKVDWLSKYKFSTFNVEVDFKIRRPGIMLKTEVIRSTGGK